MSDPRRDWRGLTPEGAKAVRTCRQLYATGIVADALDALEAAILNLTEQLAQREQEEAA